MARTLGVSEKTWSRHEAGVRIPFVRLARFCDAYVFSIESLYARLPLWTDGLKRPTSPSSPPGVAESDVDFIPGSDGDILLDLFNRLSPPERKIVLSAAHGIARKL